MFVSLGVTLVVSLGCGRTDQEKAAAKASLLKEIGVSAPPVPPDPQLPSLPKIVKDDATEAWVDVAKLPPEHWEIQYKGNEPVGYTHRSVKMIELGQEEGLQLQAKSQTHFKSGNQLIEQEVEISTIERANGEVRKLDGLVKVGTLSRRFEGNIKDGYLILISDTARSSSPDVRIPWTDRDRGPFAIEQSLQRLPMQEEEKRTLRYFDPIMGEFIDVELQAFDYFDTPTLDGTKERLLEIQITSRTLDGESRSQIWVDEQGRGHKSYAPPIDLLSFRCNESTARYIKNKTALADLSLRPVSVSGRKIGEFVTGSITYEVVTTDEKGELDLSSRTNQIVSPEGNERRREVTVYPSSLLEDLSGIDQEPAPEANTLSESPLINSKHPEIRQLALSLLQQAELTQQSSVTERAIAFQRGIASRVKETPFDRVVSEGHVTLRRGEGDCFDQAVLLAATCRADGISSRIAIGLLLKPADIRSKMILHAWVEYHDGARWVPIDSTLAEAETFVGADRIKWREDAWDTRNPYASILSLAEVLGKLNVKVLRSSR